jgi:hypothetical protein
MTTKKNAYADKFFSKKMKPGEMFGDGFVGVIEDGKKEKPVKPFTSMEKYMR